jgi:hypothetical protein
MFMGGVALIVAALILAQPSPVGCKGGRLLWLEATMVGFAAMWAALIIADPGNSGSNHPVLLIGDACWPLHQALMLVIGIVAVRADRWPSPAKYTLFGPAAGLVVLIAGAALGVDIVSATAIGAGWVIAAAGVIAVTSSEELARGCEIPTRAVPAS